MQQAPTSFTVREDSLPEDALQQILGGGRRFFRVSQAGKTIEFTAEVHPRRKRYDNERTVRLTKVQDYREASA